MNMKKNVMLEIKEIPITFDPLDHGYPSEVCKISGDPKFLLKMKKYPQQTIETIEALMIKYPKVPVLYNFAAATYQRLGNDDRSCALVEQCYQLFPDYVFGVCNYVHLLTFTKENKDAFAQIFEGKFHLPDAFPKRTTFHVSEVCYFYSLQGAYWVFKEEIRAAKTLLSMIQGLDAEDVKVIILENLIAEVQAKPFFESILNKIAVRKHRLLSKRKKMTQD